MGDDLYDDIDPFLPIQQPDEQQNQTSLKKLESVNKALKKNISCLYKTAKLELKRRDREITQLKIKVTELETQLKATLAERQEQLNILSAATTAAVNGSTLLTPDSYTYHYFMSLLKESQPTNGEIECNIEVSPLSIENNSATSIHSTEGSTSCTGTKLSDHTNNSGDNNDENKKRKRSHSTPPSSPSRKKSKRRDENTAIIIEKKQCTHTGVRQSGRSNKDSWSSSNSKTKTNHIRKSNIQSSNDKISHSTSKSTISKTRHSTCSSNKLNSSNIKSSHTSSSNKYSKSLRSSTRSSDSHTTRTSSLNKHCTTISKRTTTANAQSIICTRNSYNKSTNSKLSTNNKSTITTVKLTPKQSELDKEEGEEEGFTNNIKTKLSSSTGSTDRSSMMGISDEEELEEGELWSPPPPQATTDTI